MPPSPRIKADIDQEKYKALCFSLNLVRPPSIRFVTTGYQAQRNVTHHGNYGPETNSIVIFLNLESFDMERLRFLTSCVLHTFLHEMRHAWQQQTWTKEQWFKDDSFEYHAKPSERDANNFANTQDHLWRGLVRIRRVQHGSGFSKLARHTAGRIV